MAAAKTKSSKHKTDNRSTEDKLIDAALALAAERPWRTLALPEIADHAKVQIGEALLSLPSRDRIQRALIDRVDAEVFAINPKSYKVIPLPFLTFFEAFPLFSRISHPFRFVVPALLGIGLLAGFGVQWLKQRVHVAVVPVAVEPSITTSRTWP